MAAPFRGLTGARRLLLRPGGLAALRRPQRAGYARQSSPTPFGDEGNDKAHRPQEDLAASLDPKASKQQQAVFPRLNEPHYHVDTLPPTDAQLAYAATFFAKAKPHFLFSCSEFRHFPAESSTPEVAFLGRSNVGKSSLLNALLGKRAVSGAERHSNTAKVSSKPGRTKTMNCFAVRLGGDEAGGVKTALRNADGDIVDAHGKKTREAHARRWIAPGHNQLVVVDMPGYGYGSRDAWGTEIMKYLTGRRQLRRAYVLVDAEHGCKDSDNQILQLLAQNGVPHQVVLCKADKLLWPRAKLSASALARGCLLLRDAEERTIQTLRTGAHGHRSPGADEGKEGKERARRGAGSGQPGLLEVLAVSSEKSLAPKKTPKIGIDGLRWAVLREAGMESISGVV
ncbi:uncharacterized protein K452DRAFT_291446 [Aplosporella prunicola CBS 121167]|uniref:EngB-type G domain-containing protein n=1 Tax=Aplosporella prunicola CBS 121167 TaxID=1176127 RepID=A0A6A6B3T7_9PEZI|nr:uncharacterized protein K452DRAFT_291446 [Aplosporella prunicola CBS 121167]KAF2137627.1 hypothetical protein K452DRAFT_291446 [Aplosporella prunicola CBS 121167]